VPDFEARRSEPHALAGDQPRGDSSGVAGRWQERLAYPPAGVTPQEPKPVTCHSPPTLPRRPGRPGSTSPAFSVHDPPQPASSFGAAALSSLAYSSATGCSSTPGRTAVGGSRAWRSTAPSVPTAAVPPVLDGSLAACG